VVRDLPLDAPRTGEARADLLALARGLAAPRPEGLPSLTGGLMGYLSYEAAGLLDGHPAPDGDVPCPQIGLLVVDRAVVFDHWRQRLLLVAHVRPGDYEGGVQALMELAGRLTSSDTPVPEPLATGAAADAGEPNMPDERYREIVRTMKEHIAAGDIYQAVPSRRVTFASTRGGMPIYRRLRVANPAPYMFFVRMLGWSSPAPRPSRSCGSRTGT
jgi:anthranilate synthase component 1